MTIHAAVIQKLLSTNAHLGRRVAAHHFKIYSCGSRNAMTIIDSDKTLICLRNACNFMGNLVRLKGRFLFVNTNTLFDEIIEEMTKAIGIKNDKSWRLGGFLTNSSSPKKFRGRNKKLNLGAIHAPDCVVIFDTERKSSVILEAERLQVPIVGLVDSSMPWETYKKITYPVPANDSVQFVYLFCNLITKTFLYEQRKMKAAQGADDSTAGTRDDDLQIETASKRGKIFVLPYESLQPAPEDVSDLKQLLDKAVVLKFNGRLGTNMGLNGPKSTIEVQNGMTCLDLVINQIESLNAKYGCNIPLLLANTVNTHDSTLKVLQQHTNKNIHAFLQSEEYEDDSDEAPHEDRMYASSHSEVYLSLKNSGKLDVLLSQGKEYILVLNSDNLAQVIEPKIISHLVQNNIETCMEVMPASSDLEVKEVPSHEGKYESKENLKFTDTVWVSMNSIESLMHSSLVESSAISEFFDQASAISVPKSRYLPVEATSDLLLYQSDLYSFDEGIPTRSSARTNPADPLIELGPEFADVTEFHGRFKSMPSIIELDALEVTGDVWFGSDVTLKGKVSIHARPDVKMVIPDGAVLENRIITRPRDVEGPL
ncbi:UTP--glucose-1-phosphate uridylyltransferase-like [Coffea eugenioides]|uniref:UTP--glucose-1-phosphate uridylyltransferase-like n=1 Tax=Coffea eugenioides TaxID=49369 RepID=UPI000F60C94C|nr:UTP--glucose-1-phosphate uridylyltransferase-like [Coffea eugenioides]